MTGDRPVTPRVVAGAGFPRGEPSALHDLARALRAGDADALEAVAAVVLAGLARQAPALLAATGVTVVPMAGHLPGEPSGASRRLAERLALDLPGWVAGAGPARIAVAPSAIDGGPRAPATEAATLRWPGVAGAGPVVLVDDVVRSGATLEAAWLAAPAGLRARLVLLAAFRAEG